MSSVYKEASEEQECGGRGAPASPPKPFQGLRNLGVWLNWFDTATLSAREFVPSTNIHV